MELIKDNAIDFDKYMSSGSEAAYVRPASAYVDRVIDRIHGQNFLKGETLPWNKTRDKFRFGPGELTIWAGAKRNKKSMLLGMIALSIIKQGKKCCIASFEMLPEYTLERMTKQAIGVGDPSEEWIKKFNQDWTKNKLYLYDQQGRIDRKRVCAMTRYCMQELKIDHVFIDSMMKCTSPKDYDGQAEFVNELQNIARDNRKHVHLVVHRRKPQQGVKDGGIESIKGAGEITDQADNVFIVNWNFKKHEKLAEGDISDKEMPDMFLKCEAQRNGAFDDNVGLWFIQENLQFVGNSDLRAMSVMIDDFN